jgi:Zn-dependent protease
MFHLGSIRGTSIDVDFSFLILAVFFVAMNYNAQQGIQYALIWVPIIFLSVLIHELAHAAMIGLFGYGSSQIVLGGMGGVTMNERKAKPWQDMLISVAGPASSFALWFICLLIIANVPLVREDQMLAALMPRMALANWFWALFNLIPVAPLDGGHAVRELLRTLTSERNAFIVATWIAIFVAGGIAIWMFVRGQIFIGLFIGWFVYVAFEKWRYFRQHGVPGD